MEVTTKYEADKLSWQFFGRPLPMTHDEMKSAFRAACKRLHPDVAEVPELTPLSSIKMSKLWSPCTFSVSTSPRA